MLLICEKELKELAEHPNRRWIIRTWLPCQLEQLGKSMAIMGLFNESKPGYEQRRADFDQRGHELLELQIQLKKEDEEKGKSDE